MACTKLLGSHLCLSTCYFKCLLRNHFYPQHPIKYTTSMSARGSRARVHSSSSDRMLSVDLFLIWEKRKTSHHLGRCASWCLAWTGERSWLWRQEIYLSHLLWRLRAGKVGHWRSSPYCLICRITETEHPSPWVLLFILLECFVSRGNHLFSALTKPHNHHPCLRPGLLSRERSKRAQEHTLEIQG